MCFQQTFLVFLLQPSISLLMQPRLNVCVRLLETRALKPSLLLHIYPKRKQLNFPHSFLKLILEQKREVKTWAEQKIKPTSSFPFILLLQDLFDCLQHFTLPQPLRKPLFLAHSTQKSWGWKTYWCNLSLWSFQSLDTLTKFSFLLLLLELVIKRKVGAFVPTTLSFLNHVLLLYFII